MELAVGIGVLSSSAYPSHSRATFGGLVVVVVVVARNRAAKGLEEGVNLVGNTGHDSAVIGCLLGDGAD